MLKMEDCKCKEQCLSKISVTIRKLIHEDFQNLSTNCEKYLYFSGLIYKVGKKKKGRRKSKTDFQFHVRVDGHHIRICQKAFEIIHGIKRLDICKLLKKLNGNRIRVDPDEEFTKHEKLKPKARSTNSKKFVEEHVKSILTKSEVREHIMKGDKPNFTTIYEDYKMMLGTYRRMATIDFDKQLIQNENEENIVDYNPVSLKMYVSLFGHVYSEGIKEFRKESNSDLNQRGRSQSSHLANKTPNCKEVTNLKKAPVRKRKNLSDRSILPSQIKRLPPSSMNYCIVTKDRNPQCVDQSISLGLR